MLSLIASERVKFSVLQVTEKRAITEASEQLVLLRRRRRREKEREEKRNEERIEDDENHWELLDIRGCSPKPSHTVDLAAIGYGVHLSSLGSVLFRFSSPLSTQQVLSRQ